LPSTPVVTFASHHTKVLYHDPFVTIPGLCLAVVYRLTPGISTLHLMTNCSFLVFHFHLFITTVYADYANMHHAIIPTQCERHCQWLRKLSWSSPMMQQITSSKCEFTGPHVIIKSTLLN